GPPARASAASVENGSRPDSAPTNTPTLSGSGRCRSRPAAAQASRAAASASAVRRSLSGKSPSIAAAWRDGRPLASKERTGPIAHLPAASASRVSRQVPPSGVTAPTPLTHAARTSLSDRTGKPGLQDLAPPLDEPRVADGHE